MVYTRDTQSMTSLWTFRQKLTGSDAVSGNIFGYDVHIHSDIIVASDPFDNNLAGAAYFFRRDVPHVLTANWSERSKFTSANCTGTSPLVGRAVSVDFNTAAVTCGTKKSTGRGRGTFRRPPLSGRTEQAYATRTPL